MTAPTRIDPFTRFVRELDGEYYLLREAATLLQVNHRVLREINSDESRKEYWPSFFTYMGKIKLYLYTDDDVAKLRQYFEERRAVYPISENPPNKKMGRPAQYTAEQKKIRQRLYSQAHYYKKMARKHTAEGELDKAKLDLAKAREIQLELKNG